MDSSNKYPCITGLIFTLRLEFHSKHCHAIHLDTCLNYPKTNPLKYQLLPKTHSIHAKWSTICSLTMFPILSFNTPQQMGLSFHNDNEKNVFSITQNQKYIVFTYPNYNVHRKQYKCK